MSWIKHSCGEELYCEESIWWIKYTEHKKNCTTCKKIAKVYDLQRKRMLKLNNIKNVHNS